MKTVVVAATYRQFEQWCRDNGISPKDYDKVVHVGGKGHLYRVRGMGEFAPVYLSGDLNLWTDVLARQPKVHRQIPKEES